MTNTTRLGPAGSAFDSEPYGSERTWMPSCSEAAVIVRASTPVISTGTSISKSPRRAMAAAVGSSPSVHRPCRHKVQRKRMYTSVGGGRAFNDDFPQFQRTILLNSKTLVQEGQKTDLCSPRQWTARRGRNLEEGRSKAETASHHHD